MTEHGDHSRMKGVSLARLKDRARLYSGLLWNILRGDPHTRRRMRQQQRLAAIRDWFASR